MKHRHQTDSSGLLARRTQQLHEWRRKYNKLRAGFVYALMNPLVSGIAKDDADMHIENYIQLAELEKDEARDGEQA